MKIVAISDLHGRHKTAVIPECDLLLIAGDITPRGEINMLGSFCKWLGKQDQAKHKVVIAGNHDWCFEMNDTKGYCRDMVEQAGAHYLENSMCEVTGKKIYGSPWTPAFCNWAFNGTPEKMKEVWGAAPACDILVTHGPPYGILDKVNGVISGTPHVERVGDHAFRKWIGTHSPELAVFGHIHDAHGIIKLNKTLFCNVSMLDDAYEMVYSPTTIDL